MVHDGSILNKGHRMKRASITQTLMHVVMEVAPEHGA